jgi:hypothetical protein
MSDPMAVATLKATASPVPPPASKPASSTGIEVSAMEQTAATTSLVSRVCQRGIGLASR